MNKLPKGWQVKSLGEVANVKSGFAFKSEDYLDKGIRLVRIGNLNGSSLDFGEETVFVDVKYLDSCKEFSLKENDVLIAMSGATTGKLALVKQNDLPCLLNQRVGLISILNHQELNAKYLFYYLAKGDLRKQVLKLAGGSAQPNISPTQIMSFKIPLPPLPIQEQIAEILEKADEAKQKRKEANKLTDEFLQSVFIEMFGDPVKNPKGWEKEKIKSLGNVTTGSTPSSSLKGMFGGTIPFITPGDLENNNEKPQRFVTEAGAMESRIVLKGSTMVCCIGATIGKMDIAKVICAFNQQINAIEWYQHIDDIFGLYSLKFLKTEIISKAKSTTLPILKKSLFEEIKIPVPPLSFQQQFAEIVNKTVGLKEKQKQSEQELENLFQSLMQRAFKGELL